MSDLQELEQQIETLIRAHLAECRAAVTAVVQRAFVAATSEPAPRPQSAKAPPVRSRRRSQEELSALSEALYAAVCARPGETMAVFASQLGTTSAKLDVPVTRLKRAGRVRSVGQRANTRYFPLVGDAREVQA
jgi:hypothetical protein